MRAVQFLGKLRKEKAMQYYKDNFFIKKHQKIAEKGLRESSFYLFLKGRYDRRNNMIQKFKTIWISPFILKKLKTYESNSSALYNEINLLLFFTQQEKSKLNHKISFIDEEVKNLIEEIPKGYTVEEMRKRIDIERRVLELTKERIPIEKQIKLYENDINLLNHSCQQILYKSKRVCEIVITKYLQAAKEPLDPEIDVSVNLDETAKQIYEEFVKQYR